MVARQVGFVPFKQQQSGASRGAGPTASFGPGAPHSSARQVFRVEVLYSGRRHTVPRRYSEFHALHKRVRCRGLPTDLAPGQDPGWHEKEL